jgi:competence ComEA-like helix-hairpin-helix protein
VSNQEGPAREVGWAPRQRTALLVILVGVLAYCSIRFALNSSYISNPQPDEPPRAKELADRIDPNTADADELAALPTLGEKRAKAIVEYRGRFGASATKPVFLEPNDMLRIRGIGAATLDQIRPFLKFPSTQPTTAPASR